MQAKSKHRTSQISGNKKIPEQTLRIAPHEKSTHMHGSMTGTAVGGESSNWFPHTLQFRASEAWARVLARSLATALW
jgi:hypothetical protein